MTTVRPRPLVLFLVVGAAVVAIAHAQALECSTAQSVIKDSSVVLPLDQQATTSMRFTTPRGGDRWDAVFGFGEGYGTNFTPRINLELKKVKPKAYFYQMKLYDIQASTTFLSQRIAYTWLDDGRKTTMYTSESTLSIAFQNGDSKLLLQLTDPQIEGLEGVQVTGDMTVEECEGPERVPESTTTTTSPATTVPTTESTTTTTTTTIPTTTTPIPTTTTPIPTTTTPVTTTSATTTEAFITAQDNAITDTTTTTASESASPYTCLPTEDSETSAEGTTVCTPPAAEPVIEFGGSEKCQVVPRWAWACAALAVVFFLFILGLIAYSITLYKRSWRSGRGLTSSGSGAFGMSAQDMYYYEMKDPNLMIGNTVPRIKTPRPSSTPGLTPSNSTSRLSCNYPSTPSPTPNTLSLPCTDLGNSMDDITVQKDKSRSSKVSFADD